MKDFKPLPRPVDVLFPPRATVIADKTALFPPVAESNRPESKAYQQSLTSVMT